MRRTILILLLTLIALTAGAKDRFSYMFSVGNDTFAMTSGSVDEIVRVNKLFSGRYLYANLDGRQYIIRDAGVLAEVHRASADIRALDPDRKPLRRKVRPLERQERRLESELDDLTDRDSDEGNLTDAEHDRMRKLRDEVRDLERELRGYEREESRLDRRHEQLEGVFEGELKKIVERAIRAGTAERVQ